MYVQETSTKWIMFTNDIFANITSFAKFAKISSHENFQVHGIYEHEAIQKTISENNTPKHYSTVLSFYVTYLSMEAYKTPLYTKVTIHCCLCIQEALVWHI